MIADGRVVLFVHPSDELYGSDRCLLEAVRSLNPEDRAIVALPADIDYEGRLREALVREGADVRYIDMLILRRSLLRLSSLPALASRLTHGTRELMSLIRTDGVDLVHTSTLASPCGPLAARLTHTPHLWQIHEHLGDEPWIYRTLLRAMLQFAPGLLVANSRAVAQSFVGRCRRLGRRTRIIRNAVSPEIGRAAGSPRAEHSPPRIGVIGRLSPRKGIREAIDAAAILAALGAEFELHFFGGVPPNASSLLDDYRRKAHELGLSDRLHFHGVVDDVTTAYGDIDILLVPSQRPEPFGLVIIEGMMSGLPVVVTRNGGGSDELLDHGKTGIYCGRSPAEIARSLQMLLQDHQLRRSLGRQAVASAKRHYNIDRYHRAVQRAHTKVLAQTGVELTSGW